MSLHRHKVFSFPRSFAIRPVPNFPNFESHFLEASQRLVDALIPEPFWRERERGADAEALLFQFEEHLPLFRYIEVQTNSRSVSVSYICPANYTHQARRYVVDALAKWLIPGKQLDIIAGISLHFRFVEAPTREFQVAQEVISIRNSEEADAIRKNLPDLILQLKQKLPCEFLRQAENNVHSLFMPRNEEEMIRNLIVLTHQIKYVRDLPQVSIHYEKQTDVDLTFTVIIVRLLKGNIDPLKKRLEKSTLKMDIDDVRVMGCLKQKYPKEAAVLRVCITKRPFFRADFSVDLLRARQKITAHLAECIGEFRDFNGGMILKQDEAFRDLQGALGRLSAEKEFLLENYFYSLHPGIMQTVLDPELLKRHFEILIHVLSLPQPQSMYAETHEKYWLCFLALPSLQCREKILDAIAPLQISSRNLTTAYFQMEQLAVMGFILRKEPPELAEALQAAIEEGLRNPF